MKSGTIDGAKANQRAAATRATAPSRPEAASLLPAPLAVCERQTERHLARRTVVEAVARALEAVMLPVIDEAPAAPADVALDIMAVPVDDDIIEAARVTDEATGADVPLTEAHCQVRWAGEKATDLRRRGRGGVEQVLASAARGDLRHQRRGGASVDARR